MPLSRAERLAQLDTRIDEVVEAISRVATGGQAYAAEGRQMTKADLAQLRQLEHDLKRERAAVARGGRIRTFGVVVSR